MAFSLQQLEEDLRVLATYKSRHEHDYVSWLQCTDVLSFLGRTTSNLIPIMICMKGLYLYSVLVPRSALTNGFEEDIMRWSLPPSPGWGYSIACGTGDLSDISLSRPLERTGSRVLDQGEPIVFLRHFAGRSGKKSYPELNQRLAHIMDVHWIETRNAYSKLDELGDFKDVVPVKNDAEGTIVAVAFDELELYMFLTDSVLIRLFDFARSHDWRNIVVKERKETSIIVEDSGIYAKHLFIIDGEGPVAGKLRGFQIIKRRRSDKELLAALEEEGLEPKQYESFIALDFKHQRIHECSCDPSRLGNYFEPSDLPFETSPVFFRPEVLLKYKQDPDKYEVKSRMIVCRAGWSLHYGINEEGQVHVYLKDLGQLPHAEQLYWKAFNELPKAGISKRAWTTDFLAEFDTEYDPLESLRDVLSSFPATNSGLTIWVKDDVLSARLSHVVTESKKEWEDSVLTLAKLIVDGFQLDSIRSIAKSLGCLDETLRSIKLLQKCLETVGVDRPNVQAIIDPLVELWTIRSQEGIAHRGRAKTRDTKRHFYELLKRCDEAMRRLATLIKNGVLDRE